jgi:hypothetical protein
MVVAGPAPVAGAAACSGTSGVTVVVDFGALGGGVQTGCAGGDPGSGLAALSAAGHGYTFVPRQPGLVCQIDARPNPCNGAPTTAYWSYWHASRGGSWSFSTLGAGGYDPAPGTVEGWAFGAGRRPGIAPPAAPAPPPAPPPPAPRSTAKPAPEPTSPPPAATPRTSAPGAPPAPGSPADRGGGSASRPGTASTGASSSADPGRTTAARSTSAGATATAGASANGAQPAPSASDSSPPGTPVTEPASSSKTLGAFSLAVALVAAVGLAAFLVARRRRAEPPSG